VKQTPKFQKIITDICKKFDFDMNEPGASITIYNAPYMPLLIHNIAEKWIAVSHIGEQNGDVMHDPEIVLWIRRYPPRMDGEVYEEWFPTEYRQDYLGFHQNAVAELGITNDPARYYVKMQRDIGTFVNSWAANIRAQGFLTDGAIDKPEEK
jgi:hypothetical protein